MGEETYGGEKTVKFVAENEGLDIEALSEDNEYLFSATIGRLSPSGEEFKIKMRRGKEIPDIIAKRDKIKLVTAKSNMKKGDQIAVINGAVTEVGKDFIYVAPNDAEEYTEGRRSFRLSLRKECIVRRSGGSQKKDLTADISLTGICIISDEEYEPGEEITVSDLQIIDGGKLHTLPARVIRKNSGTDDKDKTIRYGCCFENLPESVEDKLCHDIFALQLKRVKG